MTDPSSIIHSLELTPHPEGGFYREMYRSNTLVKDDTSPSNKSAYTSIYYLLEGQNFSSFHRIKSDETWFFHLGHDVLIYLFNQHGVLETIQLGLVANNFQATIPANTWFGAKLLNEESFCLVSCAVAPGFEFKDFEIAKSAQLLKEFGNSTIHIQAIKMLTRD